MTDADAELIIEIRGLVRSLRKPTIKQLLHEKNLNGAILDVETRWSSVYYMVMYILIFSYCHFMLQFFKFGFCVLTFISFADLSIVYLFTYFYLLNLAWILILHFLHNKRTPIIT